MVGLRINETLQTGAVGNRTYRVGVNAVRSQTVPTRANTYQYITAQPDAQMPRKLP